MSKKTFLSIFFTQLCTKKSSESTPKLSKLNEQGILKVYHINSFQIAKPEIDLEFLCHHRLQKIISNDINNFYPNNNINVKDLLPVSIDTILKLSKNMDIIDKYF